MPYICSVENVLSRMQLEAPAFVHSRIVVIDSLPHIKQECGDSPNMAGQPIKTICACETLSGRSLCEILFPRGEIVSMADDNI